MAHFREKLDNLLEYVWIRSHNYYHSGRDISYDLDDPLAYYLNQSRRADYDGLFDDKGIPLHQRSDRTDYHPVSICFYGLGHLELYRKYKNEKNLGKFLKVAQWLVTQQTEDGTWLSPFPMKKFNLHGAHTSAMTQGLAISCLSRASLLEREDRFIEAAITALSPFHKGLKDRGLTSQFNGYSFYEEYPAFPLRHVLNGFIYTLWGLYDLTRIHHHTDAEKLYQVGVETLRNCLHLFDTGYWSLYHVSDFSHSNPAAPHYHRLHIAQLRVMYELTGDNLFREYSERWEIYQQGHFNALRTLPAKLRWLLLQDN
ncbi:MAG: D-glucuronyl C5-epimerase family protein [candidate division Zixibacteria bacterium]|nr:D-glucuronyl C5-epimerase family protein [candidate division Zixibacteria bacterium]